MDKIIFLVTSGNYDEYCVRAVFSTHYKAEKYIKILGNSEARIEEYYLDITDSIPKDMYPFVVFMSKDGEAFDRRNYNVFPCIKSCINNECVIHYNYSGFTYFTFAKDFEHAIEITEEKRLELISNKKFEKEV